MVTFKRVKHFDFYVKPKIRERTVVLKLFQPHFCGLFCILVRFCTVVTNIMSNKCLQGITATISFLCIHQRFYCVIAKKTSRKLRCLVSTSSYQTKIMLSHINCTFLLLFFIFASIILLICHKMVIFKNIFYKSTFILFSRWMYV